MSTRRRYGGTGLGLSIVARLVEMMQGRIWIESEEGKGSTFHFTIHLGLQPALESAPPAQYGDLRGLRMLVVDDNATNRRIFTEVLQSWGVRSAAAGSGQEGLAALQEAVIGDDPFAVVLLDFMMPDMDGAGVVQQLRQLPGLANTLILILSSADDPTTLARCRELGVAAYLRKPVTQSELFEALVQSLGMSAPELAPALAQQESPVKALRILLVEDNPFNQMVARGHLQKAGHQVRVASNGREALEVLDTDTFDLTLMDVQMPEMDGFEATAAIRQREQQQGGHLPIVGLTAHAMQGDRERCIEAGMDEYLPKPIDRKQLIETIAAVVSQETPSVPSPQAPPAAEAVVDLEVLANLKELEDGGDFSLAEFFQVFAQDCARRMGALRQAIKKEDAHSLEREAHTLKGSSRELGARHMAALCQQLEDLGEAGATAGTTELVAGLEEALMQVGKALEEYRGQG